MLGRWGTVGLVLTALAGGVALAGSASGQADGDATTTLSLNCKAPAEPRGEVGHEAWSLESTWIPAEEESPARRCAMHVGHHTYAAGLDRQLQLQGGVGSIFLVEQTGFSPADQVPTVRASSDRGVAAVTDVEVQVSQDGIEWTTVATADHRLVDVDTRGEDPLAAAVEAVCFNTGSATCPNRNDNVRQQIRFEIDADGEPFSYVRVANPESVYTGLTGFLDRSSLTLEVTASDQAAPELAPVEGDQRTCEADILERLHSEDPCSFGGYLHEEAGAPLPFVRVGNVPGHWDAPSFFHTYPLERAELDAVEGEVTVRDYRVNDADAHNDRVYLQARTPEGVWTQLASIEVDRIHPHPSDPDHQQSTYAARFEVTGLDGLEATMLRLVAEPHPPEGAYWSDETSWPDRHPWAFLVDSELAIDGRLPS
jgi:hypothetical protein